MRRVLLLEDRDVRIIEKALFTQLARNQRFSLFDREAAHSHRTKHGQGDLTARINAHVGFEIWHAVQADFE